MKSREACRRIAGGSWIPAFAGMTGNARAGMTAAMLRVLAVIPAKAGIAGNVRAGMTAAMLRVLAAVRAKAGMAGNARAGMTAAMLRVLAVIPAKAGIHVGPRHGGIGTSSGGFRHLVLTLAIAATGGCGYQLRGGVSLPPGLDAVRIAGPIDIRNALTQLLDSGGVHVQPVGGSAEALLQVSDERFNRRVLSVDPNTGKERGFELACQVTFEVIGAQGEELVPKQTVSLIREYVFDTDAVLGTSREQGVLRAEMRRDAAAQIVRRIAASLGR